MEIKMDDSNVLKIINEIFNSSPNYIDKHLSIIIYNNYDFFINNIKFFYRKMRIKNSPYNHYDNLWVRNLIRFIIKNDKDNLIKFFSNPIQFTSNNVWYIKRLSSKALFIKTLDEEQQSQVVANQANSGRLIYLDFIPVKNDNLSFRHYYNFNKIRDKINANLFNLQLLNRLDFKEEEYPEIRTFFAKYILLARTEANWLK